MKNIKIAKAVQTKPNIVADTKLLTENNEILLMS